MNLREALQSRIQNQTKPPGSLGVLEDLGLRLGLLQGSPTPRLQGAVVIVFGASHGIAHEGVSAYPGEVTAQMMANFLGGGAAVCVLARSVGAELRVVDVGVDAPSDAPWRSMPSLRDRAVARGTASFLRSAAMLPGQCQRAIEAGALEVRDAMRCGAEVIALGEMGIGNTSSAAALCAALLEVDPHIVTGRGTGVDDLRFLHKRRVISAGVALHKPDAPDGGTEAGVQARFWLERVGGFEIAALAGAILEARAVGIPVVVDGFIVSTAALVASRMDPGCAEVCFFAHRSAEQGHGVVLDHLGARPLLDLGMRLGEGSGAVLAIPLLRAAARLVSEMATFESAGVSSAIREEPPV